MSGLGEALHGYIKVKLESGGWGLIPEGSTAIWNSKGELRKGIVVFSSTKESGCEKYAYLNKRSR